MGLPTTPQDSAPAYEDVIQDHPVNQYTPSGSASAYSAVPQDDVEMHAHMHDASPPTPQPQGQESLAQTIAGVFRPKPHVHCKECDVMTQAREQRENEKHCCTMVAVTFIVAFICALLLGIVVAGSIAKIKRHNMHD
ncbi:uncharacterized protein BDR25DRAFT_242968 [Lindgomyces ingoldianus]|uniref:Uncharacterized protein n=1 Tax=Lindgomyces ingoldianus TaxID=673940 RepID=A0ACB6QBE5_9PLEO|nr:uncharacterized protein BDR25DRAFT_242968 [Lindgomyces ingoldianus]KAF2464278.1 hypothetical protein BDR25DRAFT_242968 [Lindgomyces ingoldianus]